MSDVRLSAKVQRLGPIYWEWSVREDGNGPWGWFTAGAAMTERGAHRAARRAARRRRRRLEDYARAKEYKL